MHYIVFARPIEPLEEGYWVAAIPVLDIEAYGHGEIEARGNLSLMLDAVLAARKSEGIPIPPPQVLGSASGNDIALEIVQDSSRSFVSATVAPNLIGAFAAC